MKRGLLCVVILFITNYLLFSNVNHTVFENLSVDKGLSHSDVTDIIQDQIGFVWFATYNGLCKYDGNEIKIYRIDNSKLSNNRIQCLYGGADSLIYIGTETGGLNIYNSTTDSFQSYLHQHEDKKTIAANTILDIFEDLQHNIWVCTNNGISKIVKDDKLNKLKFESFYPPGNDKRITSGCAIDEETLLLGTGDGALLLNTRTGECVPFYSDKIKNYVHTILKRSSTNEILLGTKNGLLKYDSDRNRVSYITDQEVLSVIEDSKGNVWIGTRNNGLYSLNTHLEIIQIFQADISVPNYITNNEIKSLFEDKSGILWIGSIGDGAFKMNLASKPIKYYTIENKVGGRVTYTKTITLIEDRNGLLWIGTRGRGIEILDRKTERKINLIDSKKMKIKPEDVSAFYQDQNGAMWIGTWKGLYYLSPEETHNIMALQNVNLINIQPEFSSLDISIYKIHSDRDSHIWLSTSNGVYHYIPSADDYYQGNFVHYAHEPFNENSISDNFVTDIYADTESKVKTIWIGTRKGLNKLTFEDIGIKIRRIEKLNVNDRKTNKDFISVIHPDSKGRLWVATLGSGLYQMVGGRFEDTTASFISYNRSKYNFIDNEFESLLEDNHGNFWIGGQGITKFNPDSNTLKIYNTKDNLQSNSFKIWAACKLKSGEMAFGGNKGFNIFYPDSLKNNQITSQVLFTGLSIFEHRVEINDTINGDIVLSKSLTKTSQISLSYKNNNITFKFSLLHYSSPLNNEYKYKLEGFDEQWYYTDGNNPQAVYTNLRHGTYRFVVYGANSDGVWTEVPATLQLEIAPPFWETKWAYFCYFLFFILFLYFIRLSTLKKARQRLNLEMERNLREKQQKDYDNKLQFFTNISHELKTPLALISVPVEELLDSPNIGKNTRSRLNIINQSVLRLVKLVEQILDFRKYEKSAMTISVSEVDIVPVMKEIIVLFASYVESKGITIRSSFSKDSINLYVDSDKIEKVLSNILINAANYAPENGEIEFKCWDDETSVYFSVSDNGKGIDASDTEKIFEPFYQSNNSLNGGTGIGLSLVKYIIDQHKGKVWVESEAGVKTIFHVKLQKGKEHYKPNEVIIKESKNLSSFIIDELSMKDDFEFPEEESNSFVYNKEASILLADDNDEFRKYVASILQPQYNVLLATNGLEAYEIAIAEQPDLIISDIMMPEMTGIELCKKIKESTSTSHIAVLLLTARTMQSHEIEGYTIGADAYITKPFSLKLFKSRVENLIKAQALRREMFKSQINLEPSEITISSYDEKLLKKCIDTIEENMQEVNFGVEELCEKVGVSRPQLYRKIKSYTGLSPVHFIRSIRLKRAAQILKQDNYSVTDVMEQVGFNNISYFSKIFKEEFGCTPKQYGLKDESH